MNSVKKALNSTKNKIAEHQTALMITAVVTSTAATAIMIRNKVICDNFLKEKGLYDEYYTPDMND